jgi:hypothetical protein
MADPVTRMLVAIGVALAGVAHAADVLDPTRPPSPASAASPLPGDGDDGRLVLQSVLLGPDRQVAVVSGLPLTIGDEVRGHRLLRVTHSEAVLQGPSGPVTLSLYPRIERRAVKFTAAGPMKMASSRRKQKP